ncbi:MAG: DNA repair protein RecN [Clostridia bacterium]|nr:DNA repair protein RecN [Clostridia bacterium]
MITNLHIKNIGIIDDIEINLNNGLNVLTGETGAGKTLIIDSLKIISGDRFSKDMIRKGETNSFVELCMYQPESKFALDGNIIVSREINTSGRNLCKINGRLVTVTELKAFMCNFIEIHGQNDNQHLLENNTHISYLDSFIGEKIISIREKYKELYFKRKNIIKELQENFGDDKEKQRKLDLLQYQLKEIQEANLNKSEEENLEEKRKIVLNSEKIVDNLKIADEAIGENSIDYISEAIRALEKLEDIDNKYADASNSLKNIYYELQEISRDISSYKEDTFFDEEEREKIESRLSLIYTLKRKYGNNIEEILKYKEEVEQEIEHIENMEEHNKELKRKLALIESEMINYAKKINKIRLEYGIILSEKINNELKDLEMKNASISVKVEYNNTEFYETGKDSITFMVKTNIGEDEHELSKIVSGGEMSRIMLAIKKVLADTDKISVLIFDEIDTGISGKAAKVVAEKLKIISKTHQVLCISHLAAATAMADYNYFISKSVLNKRTNTNVKMLNEEEVLNEIARISAGEINETTLKYASELRNKIAS